MNNRFKVLVTSGFVLISVIFTGCLDEYLYPMPKCTDENVVQKLNSFLSKNTLHGSRVEVNEELIILVGVNEKTKMKTCKTKVEYSLKNEDNNSIVSMMNAMPFMSDISKNRDLTYTLIQTKDKKSFIINIID